MGTYARFGDASRLPTGQWPYKSRSDAAAVSIHWSVMPHALNNVHARASKLRLALLIAALAATLAGCGSDGGSVLDPLMPPTPGEAARDAFNVYDADRRRAAVANLAAAPFGGEAPYLRTYRLLLDDPDPTVRAACVKALGMHGTVEDAPIIIAQLRHAAAFVRWEAAQALQRIHDPAAVGPLIEVMQGDADADVRMAAAEALGQYAEPRVLDALVGALVDRNYGVVQGAAQSLRTLTGQPYAHDPAPWVAWSNQNRDRLFAGQQPYSFQPYTKPPGLLDKAQFWREQDKAPRRTPAGLEAATPRRADQG